MIPKTIHYCWFGRNEKPKLMKKCIASWRRYCPDYEIIEWNEDNFDISQHPYLQWCYEHQKWAFLSDFARLIILSEHGGIYLDTDVEVVRPLDDLLEYDAFFGFESDSYINTGIGFGGMAHHPTMEAMKRVYEEFKPDEKGAYPVASCPQFNTQALMPFDLILNGQRQTVCGAEILPTDYLNPYDDPTGMLRITSHTYSIHWYGKSWLSKGAILKSQLMKPMHRLLGTDFMLFRMMRKHG